MTKWKPSEIINYAASDITRWRNLIGSSVYHVKKGVGEISNISEINGEINLYMKFWNSVDYCKCGELTAYASYIEIPNSLDLEIELNGFEVNEGQDVKIKEEKSLSKIIKSSFPSPLYKVGQKVSLTGSSTLLGIIINIIPIRDNEYHYQVYCNELESTIHSENDIEEFTNEIIVGSYNDFLRDLALVKLKKKQNNHLYSLYASRTKFEVYQFKPALKFLSNPDQRLLIADEVGLGKTIEAGIIYLELQARLDLDRVLIICPSSLRKKWHDEFKTRFDEEFIIFDTKGAKNLLNDHQKYGNQIKFRGIISLEAIRRVDLAEMFRNVMIDLLIIDEAHHCRNPETLSYDIAKMLAENSDATLLLTATPLQLGIEDLFNLLRLLAPGEFDNLEAFINRLEPNEFINLASKYLSTNDPKRAYQELIKVESTIEKKRFLDNPYYQEVKTILLSGEFTREILIKAQRKLLELNTLSNIFTRTRKRNVSDSAKRMAFTLPVTQTDEEKKFYNLVVDSVRTEYSYGRTYGWAGIMKERQAASCLSAFKEKIISSHTEPITDEEKNFELGSPGSELTDDQIFQADFSIQDLFTSYKARNQIALQKASHFSIDSKFQVFISSLERILTEEPESKILVFSYFRDTINFLNKQLKERNIKCHAMHGGYPVDERNSFIDDFKNNPSIRVLITSDVGAEGLDFQFCSIMFNYDLPWNPMKVEQRIGRIDRFGQEAPLIRIYNLVLQDTIEDRILIKLYDRIKIFEQSIGDIEEILGQEIISLTNDIFVNKLTPLQEKIRLEQILDNVVRRKEDLEQFEEKRLHFLGQEAIFATEVEHTVESGRFLSSKETYELVRGYIDAVDPDSKLKYNDSGDETYCLYMRDDLDQIVRKFIYSQRGGDQSAQSFLKRLVPGAQIPITFSQEIAYQRKLIEFITPKHPLAAAAVNYWLKNSRNVKHISKFCINTNIVPAGIYNYFIYTIDSTGVNPDTHLVPIVINLGSHQINLDLSKKLLRLIQTEELKVWNPRTNIANDGICLEIANNEICNERDRIKKEIFKSNQQLLSARRSSIEQSYLAKKTSVEKRLSLNTNDKIDRMLNGQLRNMEAKYLTRIDELNNKASIVVSYELELEGLVEVYSGP